MIDVPPESQVYRQVVRKGLDVRDFHLDPVVRLHYVEVEPPQLASPSGDLFRLSRRRSPREWDLHDLEADLGVIRALQPALEAGKYAVTVAVHGGRTITGVWPGLHDKAYGVAIDVGLDDDRRAPGRPRDRRGPRERRRDEPADPVRRGPDEPGALRDDERGRVPAR